VARAVPQNGGVWEVQSKSLTCRWTNMDGEITENTVVLHYMGGKQSQKPSERNKKRKERYKVKKRTGIDSLRNGLVFWVIM